MVNHQQINKYFDTVSKMKDVLKPNDKVQIKQSGKEGPHLGQIISVAKSGRMKVFDFVTGKEMEISNDRLSKFAELTGEQRDKLSDNDFAAVYTVKGKKVRKLPIQDRVHAIAAKQALSGARGGVSLPADIKPKAMKKVEAALKKFGVSKQADDKEGTSKMEETNYISKFADANVDALKEVLDNLKKLKDAKEIKKEDIEKLAEELEAAMVVKESKESKSDDKSDDKKEDKSEDEKKEDNESDDKKEDDDKKKDSKEEDETATKEEDKSDDSTESDDKKEEDSKDDADGKEDDKTSSKEDDKESAKKADDKEDDKDDSTSKHTDDVKAYKEVAESAVSKLKELNKLYKYETEKNESLVKENVDLKDNVSKFEKITHDKLLDSTLDEISKFKELDDNQTLKKREEISKMSESALKIMKAEFKDLNTSKFEEEAESETKPSGELTEEDKKEEDPVSKQQDAEIRRRIGNFF